MQLDRPAKSASSSEKLVDCDVHEMETFRSLYDELVKSEALNGFQQLNCVCTIDSHFGHIRRIRLSKYYEDQDFTHEIQFVLWRAANGKPQILYEDVN